MFSILWCVSGGAEIGGGYDFVLTYGFVGWEWTFSSGEKANFLTAFDVTMWNSQHRIPARCEHKWWTFIRRKEERFMETDGVFPSVYFWLQFQCRLKRKEIKSTGTFFVGVGVWRVAGKRLYRIIIIISDVCMGNKYNSDFSFPLFQSQACSQHKW